MVTRQIRVTGRVQGVGFRYALRREAERCGVSGWVRNRRDGSVEALLQGDANAVERLVQWARRGPPMAMVEALREQTPENAVEPPYERFEERPSV
jgi:acylphosphatase